MKVIGFDVFGTLIDPGGIADALRPYAGGRTGELLAEWRRTQLEHAFRRAAMGRYLPFDRVTRAALDRALTACGVEVPEAGREQLVAGWTRLPAFDEAAPTLDALRAAGHRCVAFSNGTPGGLAALLAHAGLEAHLDDVLSVEAVGIFKPAPAARRAPGQRRGRRARRHLARVGQCLGRDRRACRRPPRRVGAARPGRGVRSVGGDAGPGGRRPVRADGGRAVQRRRHRLMRRFTDAAGQEWTVALSAGSYGSVTLMFARAGDTGVYWLALEATTSAEGQEMLARFSDDELRTRLEAAEAWVG
ncbi:MAG: HAD-IA family hydrolase [Halofilum sp. (in: g-proteobacteria)]|nr:HAD-IA family hydrolase [Halofilum sp. (in: g-proteobacteria)]